MNAPALPPRNRGKFSLKVLFALFAPVVHLAVMIAFVPEINDLQFRIAGSVAVLCAAICGLWVAHAAGPSPARKWLGGLGTFALMMIYYSAVYLAGCLYVASQIVKGVKS